MNENQEEKKTTTTEQPTGAAPEQPQGAEAPKPETPKKEEDPKPAKLSKGTKIALWVIGAVTLIAGAVAGGVAVAKHAKGGEASEGSDAAA